MRHMSVMATPRRKHDSSTVGVTNADRRIARELVSLLGGRHARDRFELRGTDGRAAPLSAPMLSLIERAARIVADGTAVDVFAQGKDLTSQEAASLLGVSRQYLVCILDRGEIPFMRTGNHRRIRSADIIAYRERRDAGRREALAGMAQEAQAAGAYEGSVTLGASRAC
jgi:excisionase family DNA binding protein